MIGYYKYPRKYIVDIIKSSPKTYDGFYYVKDFPLINEKRSKLDGERDTKYFYSREYFKDKLCFDDNEIELYVTTTKKEYDMDKMRRRDEKIKSVVNDLLDNELYEKIVNQDYNLAELIDTTIYIFNIKN